MVKEVPICVLYSTFFATITIFDGKYFDKILSYFLMEKEIARGEDRTHDLKMAIFEKS